MMTNQCWACAWVIGWAAALTFGWIAIAAPPGEPPHLQTINMLLAALGAGVGLLAWLRLNRRTT